MNSGDFSEIHESGRLKSLRDAFGIGIVYLAKRHPKMLVLDGDLSNSTRTNWFADKYPDRFMNIGIAEQDMIGISAGLATCGYLPIACTFASFLIGRGIDHIRLLLAMPNLSVKLVGSHAGLNTGQDGPSHQAIDDIALMRAIPNVRVYSPCDGIETLQIVEHMLKTPGPAYMRLPRSDEPLVLSKDACFEPNKIRVIKSTWNNNDLQGAIFATGCMVWRAVEVAKKLSTEGIAVEVLDVHTIKPLDEDTLGNYAETAKWMVSIEDHLIIGGLGGAIAESLSKFGKSVPLLRLGVNDCFAESGSPEDLFKALHLDSEGIYRSIIAFLKNKEH